MTLFIFGHMDFWKSKMDIWISKILSVCPIIGSKCVSNHQDLLTNHIIRAKIVKNCRLWCATDVTQPSKRLILYFPRKVILYQRIMLSQHSFVSFWGKNRRSVWMEDQASSHNFLSMIFGIFGIFWVEICGRKTVRRKFFDRFFFSIEKIVFRKNNFLR